MHLLILRHLTGGRAQAEAAATQLPQPLDRRDVDLVDVLPQQSPVLVLLLLPKVPEPGPTPPSLLALGTLEVPSSRDCSYPPATSFCGSRHVLSRHPLGTHWVPTRYPLVTRSVPTRYPLGTLEVGIGHSQDHAVRRQRDKLLRDPVVGRRRLVAA
eukprot:1918409-Rhodomonas_salina.2